MRTIPFVVQLILLINYHQSVFILLILLLLFCILCTQCMCSTLADCKSDTLSRIVVLFGPLLVSEKWATELGGDDDDDGDDDDACKMFAELKL